MLGVKYFF